MKNNIPSYIIFGLVFLASTIYIYFSQNSFANSNFLVSLVTLIVGTIAIYLYIAQRIDKKKNAARIVLQEIRRAEKIIVDYKQTGQYLFSKKIIATNSWGENMHLFVGDLDNDELDRISDLYSTGEYLDSQIRAISKFTLEDIVRSVTKARDISVQMQLQPSPPGSTLAGAQQNQPQHKDITIPALPPVWKERLDAVSRIDPIYYSTITAKLKKIAQIQRS